MTRPGHFNKVHQHDQTQKGNINNTVLCYYVKYRISILLEGSNGPHLEGPYKKIGNFSLGLVAPLACALILSLADTQIKEEWHHTCGRQNILSFLIG